MQRKVNWKYSNLWNVRITPVINLCTVSSLVVELEETSFSVDDWSDSIRENPAQCGQKVQTILLTSCFWRVAPATYYVHNIDKDKITKADWARVVFIAISYFSSLFTKHKLVGWLANRENMSFFNQFFPWSKANQEVDFEAKYTKRETPTGG